MDKEQRKQIIYIATVLAFISIWVIVAAVLIRPIYGRLAGTSGVNAPLVAEAPWAGRGPATPVPGPIVSGTPRPQNADRFPPTWTPTLTPTSTPTATKVPTYPPWITWTPTATWTPSATPLPSVLKKRNAMRRYRSMFKKVAKRYGLDWRLMIEQGYWESGLNPHALGKDYDMGLMQIIPSTWNRLAPKIRVSDPFDPYSNVLVAGMYLKEVKDECKKIGHSDAGCMILAYNWGMSNTRRLYTQNGSWRQAPPKQRHYVGGILRAAGYD